MLPVCLHISIARYFCAESRTLFSRRATLSNASQSTYYVHGSHVKCRSTQTVNEKLREDKEIVRDEQDEAVLARDMAVELQGDSDEEGTGESHGGGLFSSR